MTQQSLTAATERLISANFSIDICPLSFRMQAFLPHAELTKSVQCRIPVVQM